MALEEFQNHFYLEFNQINDLLNELKTDTTDHTDQKIKLSTKYETISNRVEILQKYFTQNTSFIPVYEVRKAQEHLAKLNRLAQEKRDLIFPKKKFGFKSKQNMVTLESAIETAINKTTSSLIPQNNDDNVLNNINIESSCTIRDIDNKTIIKQESEINGKDIAIINVKNSCIQLYGNPSVLHVSNLENVIILCGPITGSAFINNCNNSKLVIACHQLRIHETQQTEFYINVVSRAIIENCKNVKFAPYAWSYNNIEKHFEMSSIKFKDINWNCIDDFNWLNQNIKSPNWDYLDEATRSRWITNENVSTEDNKSGHKRTKRVSECELPIINKDEEDPVIAKLTKIGCLEKHYAVQDCYFDTKDWRKCTKQVKDFQDCLKQAKENQI